MSRDVIEIVARIVVWALLCAWLARSIVHSYRLNKRPPEDGSES